MDIEITRLSSRGQIVIPLEMRRDLKEGDKLIVIRKDDEIILRKPKKILSEKAFGESWNSKEDEEAFAYLQE